LFGLILTDNKHIIMKAILRGTILILTMMYCATCMSQKFRYQNYNLTIPYGENFDISVMNYWDGSLAYVIMTKPSITHKISHLLDSLNIDSKMVVLKIWLKKMEDNLFAVDTIISRVRIERDGNRYFKKSFELENIICSHLYNTNITMLFNPLNLTRFGLPLFFLKEE